MHVSQPTIGEHVEVEDDIFSCDNNPVNTENVYVSIPTYAFTSSRRKKK